MSGAGDNVPAAGGVPGGDVDDEDEEEEDDDEEEEGGGGAVTAAAAGIDLLGLMDDIPSAPPARAAPSLLLSPSVALDQAAYQQRWASLPTASTWTAGVGQPSGIDGLPGRLSGSHVKCMAFGNVGDTVKFYFFAQQEAGALLLLELLVDRTSASASATVKATDGTLAEPFSALVRQHL